MKKLILLLAVLISSNSFAQLNYSWTDYTRGSVNNNDYPSKIKIDNNGYAYVVGTTRGIVPGEFSIENITAKKYDRFGNSIQMLYNGGDFKYDLGRDIAIDAFGNMYVLGLTQAMEFADGYQMIILKYNPAGNLLLSKIIYSKTMEASSIVVDETGNCYVLGSYYDAAGINRCIFMGLNSAFEIMWSNVFAPTEPYYSVHPKNIVWKGNFLYLVYKYTHPTSGASYGKVSKYGTNGIFLWEQNLATTDPIEIGVDNSYNVYVAGNSGGFTIQLVKYNSNGVFQYERRLFGEGECTDMEVGSDDKVYLGSYYNSFSTVTIYKFDDQPTPIWKNVYPANAPSKAFITLTKECVLASNHETYINPSLSYAVYTVMLDRNTGNKVLQNRNYSLTSQFPVGIVADKFGHCFVATTKSTESYGDDWMTYGMHYPLHIVRRAVALPGLYDFTVPGPGPMDAYGTIASINVNSITGSGNISVNFNATEPLNTTFTGGVPANVSDYSWSIVKDDAITLINAEVRFDYSQIENSGITSPADVKIYQRAVSGTGDFTELATTVAGTELRATVTSFGEFVLGSATQPLPVELNSFTSLVNINSVQLNWSTANENNNRGFAIERKTENTEFKEIGFVIGNGTSNSQHNYSFINNNIPTGKYQYRLKQTDFNGNYNYYNLNSEIIIGTPSKYSLSQNYPNPFNPATKINFEIPKEGFVSIKIYDITGREVHNLINEIKVAGYYTVSFDGAKLSSGIYFYRISTGEFTSVKKMTLVK